MTTDIVRHQGNTLAITDSHYLDVTLPRTAEELAKSSMCPDSFKGKPADIKIVGYSLADNGLRLSINTLPQCYVVHGRPGYMAQIQTAMAAMHGATIRPVGPMCGPTSATVEVILPDRSRHEVTFTMSEAEAAGLTKPSKSGAPSMYKLWPTNMLVARATTRAIGWYCPAVKLGLAGTVNMDDLDVIDGEAEDAEFGEPLSETGELVAFARAGNEILDAFVAAGHTRDAARPLARQLWESHGLEPGDSIARSRLDLILALLRALPKNPTQKDGVDSPDGKGSPAATEEHVQAGSSDTVSAGESGIEPSDSRVSGDRGSDSASAASGPRTTPEVVQPEIVDAGQGVLGVDESDEGRPF